MWFSAIKMAISAGSHIYKKRAETKMRMAGWRKEHNGNKMISFQVTPSIGGDKDDKIPF